MVSGDNKNTSSKLKEDPSKKKVTQTCPNAGSSTSTTTNTKEPQQTQNIKMENKPPSLASSLKSSANNASSFLSKGPALRQLAFGALSGWTTGFLTIRVGKPVAITVGGSIILFQLAHQQGLIKTDWPNLKHKLEQSAPNVKSNAPKMITKAKTFARGNTAFAAGFIGGFLIGLAS